MKVFLEFVHFWHHGYHYERWQYSKRLVTGTTLNEATLLMPAPRDSGKAPKIPRVTHMYIRQDVS